MEARLRKQEELRSYVFNAPHERSKSLATSYRESFQKEHFSNTQFEPKYSNESANQRYHREFFGRTKISHNRSHSNFFGKENSQPAKLAKRPSFADTYVKELKLTGIPSECTPSDIRSILGGSKVLAVQTAVDTITGKCKGTGSVKFQVAKDSDLNKIHTSLRSRGIRITK